MIDAARVDRRLLAAVLAIVGAGAAQQVLVLAGAAGLGIVLVVPAMIAVVVLWRPAPEAIACILLALGVEAILELHTGGGRYSDWLLHYELARRYAGLSTGVDPAVVAGRTPLFHQLVGAVLNHVPGFAAFQVFSVFWNSLWLWPAAVLVRRARDGQPHRDWTLVAVAAGPFVLAYSVYTWPWGLCAFFLLAAVVFAGSPGRVGGAGMGAAAAAALLVHPGALGYVAGLAVYAGARQRRALLPACLAGMAVTATALPWVWTVTHGGDFGRMFAASVPARQAVGPALWLVTRLLTVAASFWPVAPLSGAGPADWVVAFFVLTLPGAVLLTLVATRRRRTLPPPAAAMVAGGALVGLLIYPPNNAMSGMLDALYPAVVLVVVFAVASASDSMVARLAVLQSAAAVLFLGCLLLVSNAPAAGDGNLELKNAAGTHYLADILGPWPGAVLLVAAVGLLYWLVSRQRRGAPVNG